MIRTLIIDDEEKIRNTTRQILAGLRPDVEIVGEAATVAAGLELIRETPFDLLLLDIKLPDGTGFDILQQLPRTDFKIIFITAFEEYAVKAFRFSAVDYVLKPVSAHDLVKAIDRVEHLFHAEYALRLNTLIGNNGHHREDKRLVVRTAERIHVVRVAEIIRCESDQSYCHFFLAGGKKLTVSRPLKDYDEMLGEYGFFRVHKSHMVNLAHVTRFERSEGGYLIMADNSPIPVANRKRDELINTLENL